MTDELQLLRDLFQRQEVPDANATEHAQMRLRSAIAAERHSRERSPSRLRVTHPVRKRFALGMAAAVLMIGGVVVSVSGLGTQSVASASSFRLASYVTIPGFQASSQTIQFANNVTCPTSTDCYLEARHMNDPTAAAGNNVYFSGNGGNSWQQLSLPTNGSLELWGNASIGSLQCVSASSCNAVLLANFTGPGYSTVVDNVFMQTTDGGQSWSSEIMPGQPASSAQGTEPSGSPINTNAMSCPTMQFCVASTFFSSSQGESSIVWRTDNGGATWSVGSLPNGLLSPGPISCPDTQHCWIIAYPPSSGTGGEVLESFDGGAKWVDRSPIGTSPTTSWLSASCPTVNNCWLAGKTEGSDSASVVYASSDAGQTWNEASLPTAVGAESEPLKGIDTIDCNTNLTCIVLGIPQGVSEDGVNEAVLTNSAARS